MFHWQKDDWELYTMYVESENRNTITKCEINEHEMKTLSPMHIHWMLANIL